MQNFIEKNRKVIFFLIVIGNALMALSYHHFTPIISDDLTYYREVLEKGSVLGVLDLTYQEYLFHNCRFVDMLIYRLLLLTQNKTVANVFLSACFSGLGLLIYDNIDHKKKYDLRVILLSFSFMWLFLAEPGETLFWFDGGCTYLLGMVWILGFVTIYRHMLNDATVKHSVLRALGMFALGIAAGMCNENSSGGGFLLILIFTMNKLADNVKHGIGIKDSIKSYMVTAHAGILVGITLLVFGPGSLNRKYSMPDSNFTGFAGLLSKAYKITVAIKELFAPLIIIILVAITIVVIQKKFNTFSDIRNHIGWIYLVTGMIVCYVMVVIEPPTYRVYFGASVMLIIAAIQFIQDIRFSEDSLKALVYSVLTVSILLVTYSYMINLINLFRINREEQERIAIIEEGKRNGETFIIVPNYREEFRSRFSEAHDTDMTEDPGYWINIYYEKFYDVPCIIAVPREVWDN